MSLSNDSSLTVCFSHAVPTLKPLADDVDLLRASQHHPAGKTPRQVLVLWLTGMCIVGVQHLWQCWH